MRAYKYIIIASILFLCSEYVTGQQQLDWRLMTMEDGLAHRDIKYVCRDPRGFMWIVSRDIQYYDGQQLITFNQFDAEHFLPTSGIVGAIQYQDSLLVFSAGGALYALNMLTRKATSFALPDGMQSEGVVYNIGPSKADQNYFTLFATTGSDVTFYVMNTNWTPFYHFKIIEGAGLGHLGSVEIDASGVTWMINNRDSTLVRVFHNDIQVIDGKHIGLSMRTHALIGWDDYGLVICSAKGNVYGVPDGSMVIQDLMYFEMDGRQASVLYPGSDGKAWMICQNAIARFDPFGGTAEVFDVHPFGAYAPKIAAISRDQEGILWMASEVGLLEIQDEPKRFVQLLQQPPGERNMQFREILPGMGKSVVSRSFREVRDIIELTYHESTGLFDTAVVLQNVPGNGMYRGYGDQLFYLTAWEKKLLVYNLPDYSVREIPLPQWPVNLFYPQYLFSEDGKLCYQNAEYNISMVDLETGDSREIFTSKSQLLHNRWRAMALLSSQRIAIATINLGVAVCDIQTGDVLSHYHIGSTPPMSSNDVNDMLVDEEGMLWVGTLGGGVNRINTETGDVKYYITKDGLANNVIASFVDDQNGGLWIGTYHGLSMLDKEAEQFYNYYVEDGLPNNEFNYLSSCRTPDGRIYMGTLNGMVTFRPEEITGRAELPPVKLTAIQKYNRRTGSLDVLESELDSLKVVEISPYDNYVQFDFAVPSYISNNSHTFRSKLIGLEENWQELGRSHFIRYQKLPPGRYQLALMASDARGSETEEPTIIELYVHQIFYKSGWFIALCFLVIISAIYALYRYRFRLLQREQETRVRIASDLHDEVGSSLTGLSLKLQMMELQAPEGQKQRLTEVSDVIQMSIYKMRDLVWSVDARSDRWSSILERMQDYASDLLFPLEIALDFSTKGIDDNAYLDAHTKHNLYLIFKEAIHNISKHSDATKVTVSLTLDHGALKMEVRDNGTGVIDLINKGQGLQNMHMRADRLKGKLTTESVNQGFVVCLKFDV